MVQASIDSNQNNHQSTSNLREIEQQILKLFFGKNKKKKNLKLVLAKKNYLIMVLP